MSTDGGSRERPAVRVSGDLGDPVDRLLLDTLAARPGRTGGPVAVLDDATGALVTGARVLGATDVRVHDDLLSAGRSLERATGLRPLPLGADILAGAATVLLRLPKSLAALEEYAEAVAREAPADVTLLAGGRVKHMTPAMNGVLGRWFGDVSATLGRQKSRVLVAAGGLHRPADGSFPRWSYDEDLGLWIAAHGAVFAGAKVDAGTRFLLEFEGRMAPDAALALDLGCGSGVLAAALARARPQLRVVGTDDSAAAVSSALATAQANDVASRVAVHQEDAADPSRSPLPPASVDLVVCNPPFHAGAAVDEGLAPAMFRTAARLLKPGGQLWTVFNSHLRYAGALSRLVGRTDTAGRSPTFTVTVSRRR